MSLQQRGSSVGINSSFVKVGILTRNGILSLITGGISTRYCSISFRKGGRKLTDMVIARLHCAASSESSLIHWNPSYMLQFIRDCIPKSHSYTPFSSSLGS